jgi:GNAT superfamily N-acetyltransferase
MLHVRPAVASDMPVIIGFIDEAAGWLADKGTDQWSKPWPDRAQRDDRVRRGIADGCTWMVEDDGVTIATISGRPEGNPQLWSASERGELAVYVSRLIVCRDYAGQAIGNELFDWAGKWAHSQYGAQWIRIDVWTTNDMLHDYYQKRGFTFIRECDYVDYPSAMLFQKATADITDADVPRLRERPGLRLPASWAGQVTHLTRPPRRRWLDRQLAGAASLHAAVSVVARVTRIALIRQRRGTAQRD